MPTCPNCGVKKTKRLYNRHVASCRSFTSAAGGGGGTERAKKATTDDRKRAKEKRVEVEVGVSDKQVSPNVVQGVEREAGQILRQMKKMGRRKDK